MRNHEFNRVLDAIVNALSAAARMVVALVLALAILGITVLGFGVLLSAESILHEISGTLWLLLAAVLFNAMLLSSTARSSQQIANRQAQWLEDIEAELTRQGKLKR